MFMSFISITLSLFCTWKYKMCVDRLILYFWAVPHADRRRHHFSLFTCSFDLLHILNVNICSRVSRLAIQQLIYRFAHIYRSYCFMLRWCKICCFRRRFNEYSENWWNAKFPEAPINGNFLIITIKNRSKQIERPTFCGKNNFFIFMHSQKRIISCELQVEQVIKIVAKKYFSSTSEPKEISKTERNRLERQKRSKINRKITQNEKAKIENEI